MIDWTVGLACGASLIGQLSRTAAALDEARRHAGVIQNVGFPLSPLPLVCRADNARAWRQDAEAYVRLLNKMIRLFTEDPEVRSWYGIGPVAERLVLADRKLADGVIVCRLDGYLRQGTERLYLLENNADAPAGTLFTGRINRLVREVLDRTGVSCDALSPDTYLDETALLNALLAHAPHARHVAILQVDGTVTAESVAMADVFTSAGVGAYLADPRSLRIAGDRVFFGDRPADVCWNKVNTAAWRALVADDPDLADLFVRAMSTTSFVHVNPFGARYIAENKISLAFPQEPRFVHLFTAEERALVDRLLPWARRACPDLTGKLLDEQHEYVVKEPYDIRGEGVTIGRVVSRSQWRAAVGEAVRHGYLVQAYVDPVRYPVIQFQPPAVVPMSISLDSFVLNGRLHGFGSKASLNAHVNVFRGGRKLAVHVLANGSP